MPAPVPPGFTRGPIIFMGPLTEPLGFERMMQSFWDEAGGYGARILIAPTAAPDDPLVERCRRWLLDAEVESVDVLSIADRRMAFASELITRIESATGVMITDGNPLRFVGVLGGTPVAQAIRRANARGRVVCGVGRSASVLSQHMILPTHVAPAPEIQLTPSLIRFAPGLGIVNRVAFDCDEEAGTHLRTHLPRLLVAVAHNPFLIGVALDPNTGAVIYANSELEVFGAGAALIVDGWQMEETTLYAAAADQPFRVSGVEIHTLGSGYTYNLDLHQAKSPPASEIPQAGYEKFSSF
ncbi:cyanophycinase [Caldilinea sp.]|uniref:cyanophycinase n=1 Tax=Caldilinea sp. TaxID=2293560 RepID=UPI0021DC6188|nr:Type 1 glutamine amidotransferase-like domain-containing protein [Caldilinea sp.]GIV69689.1 MAG: cyanophycinase [Caldilinea sp.]